MSRQKIRRTFARTALPALATAMATTLAFAGTVAATPAFAEEARESWGSFGVQTQWMDPAVKPGDDFDTFVNGKWVQQTDIPADKTRIGSFLSLRDLSEDRLKLILDELLTANPAPGSDEARIAAAYKAFMDTDAIERAGLAPAQPYLQRIFAASTRQDLVKLFATAGFTSPIGIYVDADEKQSDRYALYVTQTGLGLPDRDYYLKDTEKFRDIRARYLDYLAFMLGKAGYQDPQSAARAVLSLETSMAQMEWDRAASRNRDLTYNKLSAAELEAMGPAGYMRTFLDTIGAGQVADVIAVEVPPTADELKVAKIDAAQAAAQFGGGLPATMKLIEDAPIATWQAYLVAHFLGDHAAFLPKEIDDAAFAFKGKVLSGQPEQRARWKRGLSAVEGEVGDLLGKIYAARYYPPAEKAAMQDLVANLRKAMAVNLADLRWMSPATRKEAQAKLDAFTPKIGAPEKYKDYAGLTLSASDPLGNSLASEQWNNDFAVNRIGKPVDRTEWFMFPQTVNAYYNPTFNEIVFPAAILQPPFFNLSADPAVNYGAIGAVIGHEMGHGFDDQGAKSDGTGNLRDWWTASDKANFEKLQDKLGAQYDAFCPFDAGKTCVNGKLTMGENIGDLGGLSLAYRAYKLSLNGKEAPVIDGYTGDQRFFLAYAQVWRSKVREEQARQFLVTDPHSPPQYRVNGIVRNFDEWYKAFDVKPGEKLYLPPAERVRIW
ncbi:M13 family metallopeptidase [Novosphingobium album (ex Liu et al. 2023)]|uniref:M13 family peptidase n=1 Tax=Novosphingobium album (ex Liu et al. 2023) TaxID=3031130 RepID=A0ABT5WLK8_9SPHN|nr:M13-type metalloendopeptidase [Novosphingobium album (ex Liu et al. 2023)]MDE8650931.1 M13 family peptidase [Novosphingobium album (ex Liu et al. 2023)]